MTEPRGTLRFRTVEQVTLWAELDGQISDGKWEDATPRGEHYKPWCRAVVSVADAEHPVGRDFYAPRDSYNFTAGDLLEVVATRMITLVRLVKGLKLPVTDGEVLQKCFSDDDASWTGMPRWWAEEATKEGKYGQIYRDNIALVERLGEAAIKAAAWDASLYDRKRLKADLTEMKAAIKVHVPRS